MTSRYQQENFMVIFKSGHPLEQYPKIKFRVGQRATWLEHIPCLNSWLLLSFKNDGNDLAIDFYDRYYMPLVEIKDFNALIDNKPFSDHPVKNKQEAFEKLVKMLRRDDYATANF